MTPQSQSRDEQATDHDVLIRLKENLIYFQDHVVGEIRDVERRSIERFDKINSELCILNKRVAECEKDLIRKQGQCDGCAKDLQNIVRSFEEYKKSVKADIDSIKEQHRKDLAVAITLASMVIGLVTFFLGKIL